MSTFFITTAIDYTNGAPHIGHAYEKVLADVLARYHRLKGEDVFFLTGVDQHGQKVQQSAEKQGVAPQEFVDGITAKFLALWKKLGVEYDGWAATTQPSHKECVRAILQRLWDEQDPATGASKWLYKKSEGGYYSVRQEQFLTDKERGEDGEFGPEWQPVEFREEENFYFRLLNHKQWLLDLIDARSAKGNPLVVPEFRVTELRNAVEKIEGDLCISRPSTRLQWGIPFPESFGTGFVTYVWFDALVNYISFAPGYDPTDVAAIYDRGATAEPASALPQDFRHWWPALHVIGKDIMVPAHGVYWPIMLKALGFDGDAIPQLLVHGWWNIKGKTGSEKMSKSQGNVVDPNVLADLVAASATEALTVQRAGVEEDRAKGKKLSPAKQALLDTSATTIEEIGRRSGADAVRYYLVRDVGTGYDSDFDHKLLVQRFNTELGNGVGNLLQRSLSMALLYRSGAVKNVQLADEVYSSLRNSAGETVQKFGQAVDQGQQLHNALGFLAGFAGDCDAFIQKTSPFSMAKDPARSEELDAVLYHLAESLRIIAILLSPVLPQAAHGIFDQLHWKISEQGQESRFRLADAAWGQLPDGHQLGQPTPLFPKIDLTPETQAD